MRRILMLFAVGVSLVGCGSKSAEKQTDEAAIERWAEEWATIESVCHESLSELEGYAADSTMLAELIASGQYVVHHSDSFNAHYAPHYRILRSDIARRLMVE